MGRDLNGEELPKNIRQRKDGRYEARVSTTDGVKSIYSRDLSALVEKVAVLTGSIITSTNLANPTLDEWFEFWFNTYKVPKIKPQSVQPMKNKYYNTFSKHLGNKKIKKLRNIDIQLAANALLDTDIARSSIREAVGRITQCLESAKNNGIIGRNPCFDIIVPWVVEEPYRRYLNQNEQLKFLNEAKNSWYYEMLYTMLCTGLRVGEIGGLKWCDIDFENKCFNIRQALSCQYNKGVKTITLTTLKTSNSYRTIPFMGGVHTVLESWKIKQDNERKRLADRWRCKGEFSDLVFTTSLGSPITRYSVEKEIKNIVKSINEKEHIDALKNNNTPEYMEHVYPHALRHTFASRCFEKGIDPKVVQTLMGHARYSTTIDIYTHVTGDRINLETTKFGSLNDL